MRTIALLLLLLSPAFAQYDLLLKGGHVIDPRNNIDGLRDVAIQAGEIAEVSAAIDPSRARKIIDASGLYITPGLVDIHTHLFHTTGIRDAWAGDNSVQPDAFSFRSGVTTMVDAGSSGWRNFETFRHTVIDRVHTRVLALINIAGLGMMADVPEQVSSDFQPKEVAAVAAKHKDVVVGVKSAHYQLPDWSSVDRAIEAGKLAGLPVMVDFGYFLPERPYWKLVTERLRPGDITTHMFRGPVPWIDSRGKLLDYLKQARQCCRSSWLWESRSKTRFCAPPGTRRKRSTGPSSVTSASELRLTSPCGVSSAASSDTATRTVAESPARSG